MKYWTIKKQDQIGIVGYSKRPDHLVKEGWEIIGQSPTEKQELREAIEIEEIKETETYQGDQLLDKDGEPIFEDYQLFDESGEPILDEKGEPTFGQRPVYEILEREVVVGKRAVVNETKRQQIEAERAAQELEARTKEAQRAQTLETLITKLASSNAQGPLKDLIDLVLLERGVEPSGGR